MKKIRAILVDDEPLARVGLRNMLAEFDNIELLAEAKNGFEAIEIFDKYNPDLLFLDIQMPGLNGFEVIQHLKRVPLVIFITAYDQYAVQAFETLAIDYLLKPINHDDLKKAIQKIVSIDSILNSLNEILNPAENYESKQIVPFVKRFAIKSGVKWLVIPEEEVVLFFSKEKYCFVRANNIDYAINFTLQELENKIDPSIFYRIHRSAIISLKQIKSYKSLGSGCYLITLNDGSEVRCSRSQSKSFRKLFKGIDCL